MIFLTLCLLALSSLQAQGKYEMEPLAAPLSINGDPTDWPTETWTWAGREPVRLAVAYDEAYLYLGFTTEDPKWQNQILMTGLSVRVLPNGQKGLTHHVGFPVGVSPALRPTDPNQLARYLFQMQRNRARLLGTMVGAELVGFGEKADTLWTTETEPLGLQAVAAWDERGIGLTVEYRIAWPELSEAVDLKKLKLHWLTGALGRPEQLRGGDAAGLNQGAPASAEERQWYQRLDTYRQYSDPREVKIRKVVWGD